MPHADPNEAAAAPASVDTGFDTTPVQHAAPMVNTVADTGARENSDPDLDARVAALLPDKSVTNWNAVSAFMAAVVPWPVSSNDAGWVNLHWSFPDKNSTAVPKTNVLKGGKPSKDIASFIKDVAWRLQRPEGFKDMFFCTSMQRDHKTSPNGTRRAAKSAAAALALKSVWVDIDVKADDPKHYHTEAEALKAILLFAKTVGLPDPSAIVRSGGGLHIYWISREALTPQEWLPYAQGLKTLLLGNYVLADTVVTTDAARILRVPGTLNHKPKYPQPMPVELVDGLPLAVYDFPKQLMFLQQFAEPTVAPTATLAQRSIWADDPTVPPGARDSFKNGPATAFAMLKGEPDLNAGIDKHEDFKVDPLPIFQKCGFYSDALLNGGKNNDQPQWNLAILGTTFMEDGNDIAHRISKNYPAYSEVETQALYDRKVAERTASGRLGWPSCTAIADAGCEACKTCPHSGKITSPLKLGTMRPEPNESDGTAQQAPNAGKKSPYSEDEWPDGYSRGGAPVKGYANTLAAFRKLGIKFTLDTFRQKEFSEGHEIEMLNGELSDRTVTMLRDQIREVCEFYPDKETVREAITAECIRNRTNPVIAYFNSLKWDSTERLPKLLHKYLGADDTPLNAAISVKLMCAIVRRSKQPGCKYDHEVVLQSDQGVRKSMFCEDLAVFPDLFTDAGDLAGSIKEQMEIAQGKQIIEFPELAGFNQNSRERNKGYLSRRVDRARLAYAHYAKDEPRSSVPLGTTNPGGYLNDPTGERRYWHAAVKKYDREAFLADKDQLYAEAVVREPNEKLWLDTPELVAAHDAIVATAKEPNTLVDDLVDLAGEVWETGRDKIEGGWLIHREERASNKDVRSTLGILGIEALRMRDIGKRMSDAMMELGWTKVAGTLVCKHGGDPEGGYRRSIPDSLELDEQQ